MPILFLTTILMDLLAGMEFDLFVPSFPEIQAHFNLSPFWVEMLLSSNFLGYCLSLPAIGYLSDRYDRKRLIIAGLATFLFGTLLCLLAPVFTFLLVGRFCQGLGIAFPAVLSFLVITDNYPLEKQQSFSAILNGIMNLSVGIAPVIGSYISLYFHWKGNFQALLGLGIITFIFTVLFVPASLPKTSQKQNVSIFQSPPLILLMTFFIFNFIPYWIFVGISPILYLEDLGVSLAHFGYYQGVLATVFAIGSLVFAKFMHRYNHRTLLLISGTVFVASLLSLSAATLLNFSNPLLITLAFLPFVIGQITPSALLYPLCVNIIPEAKGRIAAILQGGRLIFSALSLQIVGYFYNGSFRIVGLALLFFVSMTAITLFLVLPRWETLLAPKP